MKGYQKKLLEFRFDFPHFPRNNNKKETSRGWKKNIKVKREEQINGWMNAGWMDRGWFGGWSICMVICWAFTFCNILEQFSFFQKGDIIGWLSILKSTRILKSVYWHCSFWAWLLIVELFKLLLIVYSFYQSSEPCTGIDWVSIQLFHSACF